MRVYRLCTARHGTAGLGGSARLGSDGDDDDEGAAYLYLVAALEALGGEDAAVVEPGAVGGAEVLDEPVAVRWLEEGVVARGVVVVDDQRTLPPRGELGVEDPGLVADLDGDRLGTAGVREGGFALVGDRGDRRPPGLFLRRGDVLPFRQGAGVGPSVRLVGGPGEMIVVGTSHGFD